MKILQSIEDLFDFMGIRRQQLPKKHLLNLRNILIITLFVQFSVTTFTFFLFKANTFTEYANSFYITATAAFNIFTFPWNISQSRNIFKLIDQMEAIIKKSE